MKGPIKRDQKGQKKRRKEVKKDAKKGAKRGRLKKKRKKEGGERQKIKGGERQTERKRKQKGPWRRSAGRCALRLCGSAGQGGAHSRGCSSGLGWSSTAGTAIKQQLCASFSPTSSS